MPTFADKFARLVMARRDQFERTFTEEATTADEEALKERVQAAWHSLPSGADASRGGSFAVDGSQASRALANGAFMAISQALMIGPEFEETDVSLELVRGTPGQQELDRFADLLRQRLELGLALKHVERARGGTLYLDGTLHGQMRILDRGPLRVEGHEELPRRVTETYLDLLDRAEAEGVLALGVSKTSRESLLSECLSQEIGLSGAAKIPDAEMLYRWTKGPGFTTPLLLGSRDLGQTAETAMREAESPRGESESLKARLAKAPAILAFHVRLAAGEDTLRIDLPAPSAGLPQRVGDLDWRLADPEAVAPVLRLLRDGHGGLNVYNAMLYIVDKQVRLHERTVAGSYLAIVRNITGKRVQVDRSRRRFGP